MPEAIFETYNQRDMEKQVFMVFLFRIISLAQQKVFLRGLHFQKEYPQGKLVRVVKGAVFDVAVDLRSDSETYGKWFGVELMKKTKSSSIFQKKLRSWILVLSDIAEFCYGVLTSITQVMKVV